MKKKAKIITCAVLSLLMIVAALPLSGIDFGELFKAEAAVQQLSSHKQSGDYVYKIQSSSDAYITIIKYLGSDKNVVVPETIDGYTVRSIDTEAFTDQAEGSTTSSGKTYWTNDNLAKIESVVLPDTVTYIGQSAFENCSKLTSITLPESLYSIYTRAFKGTGITELVLPEGFSYLGANALEGLPITELVLPESVTDIYSNALYCETLEKITVKGHVQTFSSKAFTSYYGEKVNGKTQYESCSPDEIIFHKSISGTAPSDFPSGYDIIKDEETGYWNAVPYEKTDYKDVLDENKVYQNGYFKYIINSDNEAIIVEFTSMSTTAVQISKTVPRGNEEIPIVEIAPRAFEDCTKLKRLVIPDTIRRIGFSAFEGCTELYSINIPEGLKRIESAVFKDCESLGNITIPDTVEEICGSAFENAYLFYSENFDGSKVKIIGARAFYNLVSTLNDFVFNENLTEIAPYAFYRSGLESIVIPEGVEKIGKYAFYSYNGRNLKSVTFPSTLKSIGTSAFEYCPLTEIDLPENLEHIGADAFAYTNITAVEIPPLMTRLSSGVFQHTQITSVHIPSNIKIIGSGVFEYCPITQITIDEGVEKIYNYPFAYAEVEELTIPSTVKTIYCVSLAYMKIGTLNFKANAVIASSSSRDSLLGYCQSIDTVNFGENVTFIDDYFATDSNVKVFNFSDSIESIGEKAFYNCTKLTSVDWPANLKTIEDYAFASCINLEIDLPDTVTTIGAYAFENCDALTELILPKKTESVGAYAFSNCDGLTEVTIPENVQSISEYAFRNSVNIETVNFYASACSIIPYEEVTADNLPESPFVTSEALQKINIYGTVKELPAYLFSGIKGIDTVTLPDSVTDIGTAAFANSGITDFTGSDNLESVEEYAFYGCESLVSVELGKNIMLMGAYSFSGCNSLTEIYIPDSVTIIEMEAFKNCKNLETVRMSSNVDYIPREAFYNCVSLSSFTWDAESKLVGRLAFGGCVSLSEFDFVNLEKLYVNSFLGSGVTVVNLGETENESSPTPLTTIEVQSFKNCESLETVGIGGSVTTVKSQAFADCTSLETAVIADSVTEIANDAFDGCDNLTIYCSETSYAYSYAQAQGINVSTFVIAAIPNQTYTGSEIEPAVSVSLSGKALNENNDFSVAYANNINVGTADVTVKGAGDFKMFASRANFTIVTRSIALASVAPIVEQDYTGSAVTPSLTITDGANILVEGRDYTVSYSNNINEGTATAKITGIGNYSGSASAEFTINNQSSLQRLFNSVSAIFNSLFARIRAFFAGLFQS